MSEDFGCDHAGASREYDFHSGLKHGRMYLWLAGEYLMRNLGSLRYLLRLFVWHRRAGDITAFERRFLFRMLPWACFSGPRATCGLVERNSWERRGFEVNIDLGFGSTGWGKQIVHQKSGTLDAFYGLVKLSGQQQFSVLPSEVPGIFFPFRLHEPVYNPFQYTVFAISNVPFKH